MCRRLPGNSCIAGAQVCRRELLSWFLWCESMAGLPRIQFPCGGCRLGGLSNGLAGGLVQGGLGGLATIPGAVALLLFFVFTYLYSQSRAEYFRAWQIGWAAYSLHYALNAWMLLRRPSAALFLISQLMLFGMAFCVFLSTRLTRREFRWRWYDAVLGVAGTLLALGSLYQHVAGGTLTLRSAGRSPVELGVAALLLYSSLQFYRQAHRRQLVGLSLLAITLAFWSVLMGFDQLGSLAGASVSLGQLLGPFPQMLLGIAMVIVLFEIERRSVQENTLTFSTLGVDAGKLLDAPQLVPNIEFILDRLLTAVSGKRAMLCAAEPWREIIPSVQRGFPPDLLGEFEASGGANYLCQLAFRRSGFVELRNLADLAEPVPAVAGEGFENFRQVLLRHGITDITAFSLQTREHNFGVVLFPGGVRRLFAASQVRMAVGLALQIAMTLENYITTHAAHRRTQEYELLTQIGQADLRQKLVLLGAAVRGVGCDVVFKSHGDLQCQSDCHAHLGGSKEPAHAAGKQHYAKIVFAGLEAERRDVFDSVPHQHLAEVLEALASDGGDRLRRIGQIAKFDKAAPPEGQLAQVVGATGSFKLAQEVRRESTLDGGNDLSPRLGCAQHGPLSRYSREQPIQDELNIRNKLRRIQQLAGIHAQGGKRQGIFLHGSALDLKQDDHHGDSEQHLREGSQQLPQADRRPGE